ncbi:hypothetical protein [Oceanobacillus rekensis]|uniref:hypothetical protein n=1 Tax=Oceanobacillus rekensis TaxID=937927 RepID=UPI000B44B025|nr:hypothetical protein [Oceanobacillus rekensis]
MEMNAKLLKATSSICATLLAIGTALFLYGFFGSGSSEITAIGIGTVMGATFIFIMGIFLVATEETIDEGKNRKRQLL